MEDGVLVCKGNTCEQGWVGPDHGAVNNFLVGPIHAVVRAVAGPRQA